MYLLSVCATIYIYVYMCKPDFPVGLICVPGCSFLLRRDLRPLGLDSGYRRRAMGRAPSHDAHSLFQHGGYCHAGEHTPID